MNKEVLNLPAFPFKLRTAEEESQIFDEFRKKWLKLSPEEWVRQHLAKYLQLDRKFPAGLIALEKSLEINGLRKRCDILCYSKEGKALLIAECKAPSIKISQQTLDQALVYNLRFKVPYLLLSNGINHYCLKIILKVESCF